MRFYRQLLAAALERVESPEIDAKSLLSALIDNRLELREFKPFVERASEHPLRLAQYGADMGEGEKRVRGRIER